MLAQEQLEFARSIEGTFVKGLGPDLTAAVKSRLRAEGLDLDRPLLPAYPAADYHRWVQAAASEIYPGDSRDEACRKLGFRTISGLEDTVMGRALAAGLKLIGPKRSLQRLDRLFRNNNNYLQATVTEVNESTARVQMNHVYGLPAFYRGVFEAAMQVTGAKSPRIEQLASPPPGAVFMVTWNT